MPRKPQVESPIQAPVSKSQKKREMKAWQALGAKIVQLPQAQRDQLPMDEDVQEAVALALRLQGQRAAYRRHMQYLGQLLRKRDSAQLEDALTRLEQQSALQNAHFHALEQLRDQLLAEGYPAIDALMARHHHCDRQKLRHLVKTAQKEREQKKPPAARVFSLSTRFVKDIEI